MLFFDRKASTSSTLFCRLQTFINDVVTILIQEVEFCVVSGWSAAAGQSIGVGICYIIAYNVC